MAGGDALPPATRLCGMILDNPDLDDYFAEKAEAEPFEKRRPPTNESDDEVSADSDGFIYVAGDGAAPGGQGDYRTRSAGCSLFYGRNHSHSCSWSVEEQVKNGQRAEIRVALRWALLAWGKKVYVVDNDNVCRGVQSIAASKPMQFKSHKGLWRRMKRAVQAKGFENLKPGTQLSRSRATGWGPVSRPLAYRTDHGFVSVTRV